MTKVYRIKSVVVTVETGKLLTLKQELQPKAHALLDKVAFDIEGTAKTLAAVDTGAMRSSIYVSGTSKGGSNYEAQRSEAASRGAGQGKDVEFNPEIKPAHPFERIIAPSVVYAIYPELNGQPYIAPAVEAHRGPFVNAWGKVITG